MTPQQALVTLESIADALRSMPADANVLACHICSHNGPEIQLFTDLPIPAETTEIRGEYLASSARLGDCRLVAVKKMTPEKLAAIKAATIAALGV